MTHLDPAPSVIPSTTKRSVEFWGLVASGTLKPRPFGKEESHVLLERRTEAMYWYNPNTRTSERVTAPSTDEEAIQMLAGDPDAATFVSEYAQLRYSGMEIETALTMVGHEFRLKHHERPSHRDQASYDRRGRTRPRANGYELLLAVRLREEGREGRDRRLVYRS
jgi:hypothetical protein